MHSSAFHVQQGGGVGGTADIQEILGTSPWNNWLRLIPGEHCYCGELGLGVRVRVGS